MELTANDYKASTEYRTFRPRIVKMFFYAFLVLALTYIFTKSIKLLRNKFVGVAFLWKLFRVFISVFQMFHRRCLCFLLDRTILDLLMDSFNNLLNESWNGSGASAYLGGKLKRVSYIIFFENHHGHENFVKQIKLSLLPKITNQFFSNVYFPFFKNVFQF